MTMGTRGLQCHSDRVQKDKIGVKVTTSGHSLSFHRLDYNGLISKTENVHWGPEEHSTR